MRQRQFFKSISLVTVIGWSACTAGIGKSTAIGTGFTDRYWTLTELTAEPALDWDLDGETEADILDKLEDCERDNAIMFSSDHLVREHGGAEQCDEEAGLEREAGIWEYNNANHTLIVTGEGHEPQLYQVIEAKEDRLVLLYRIEAQDATHVLTARYAAK